MVVYYLHLQTVEQLLIIPGVQQFTECFEVMFTVRRELSPCKQNANGRFQTVRSPVPPKNLSHASIAISGRDIVITLIDSIRINLRYRDEKNNLIYFRSMIGDIYQNKVLGQSSRALYVKYLFPPPKSSRTHSSLTFEVILSADPFPILFIYNECNSNNK